MCRERLILFWEHRFFFELLGTGRIQTVKNSVFFQETHFSYIISGQVPSIANNYGSTVSFFASTDYNNSMLNLENKIAKFWQSEEILPENSYSLEEKLCQQHFDRTVKRNVNDRFTVSVLFRESVTNLGDSKDIALRRFLALERRLS